MTPGVFANKVVKINVASRRDHHNNWQKMQYVAKSVLGKRDESTPQARQDRLPLSAPTEATLLPTDVSLPSLKSDLTRYRNVEVTARFPHSSRDKTDGVSVEEFTPQP